MPKYLHLGIPNSRCRKSKIEKNLEQSWGNIYLSYTGTKIRTSDFSVETMNVRREWSEIFQVLAEK